MRTDIERLDRSRQPPRYVLEEVPGPEGDWRWRCGGETNTADGPMSKERANAAAWAHHQARHDPPAFTSDDKVCEDGEWHLVLGGRMVMFGQGGRSTAWKRYWRRKDSWDKTMEVVRAALGGAMIGDVMSSELIGAALWPDILTWPDEKMASHEAQIATAAEKQKNAHA